MYISSFNYMNLVVAILFRIINLKKKIFPLIFTSLFNTNIFFLIFQKLLNSSRIKNKYVKYLSVFFFFFFFFFCLIITPQRNW